MTSTIEETETAAGSRAKKKAALGERRTDVTPAKGKSGKKVVPKKKTPRSAGNGTREGTKTATILELLKRHGGATSKELLKATAWQSHSLRGFLSGTVGKKMGLTVTSTKAEDGERVYSISR